MTTEVADFVVIDRNHQEPAVGGHWTSPKFSTGGRNVLKVGGHERHNAYITLTFRVPTVQAGHIQIRIIVNGHPLPDLVFGVENTMNTTMAAFPASHLTGGDHDTDVVELHSQDDIGFTVDHVVIHFRQNA